MIVYKKANLEDLEQIWNKNIAENPDDDRYIRWKEQFISDNLRAEAATFVIVADGEPAGEGTLLLSPDCKAVRNRPCLCDGKKIANINALRIQKQWKGQGHISALVKHMEQYALQLGLEQLTIGVEAAETRNLGIYLHWGYNRFVMSEIEDDTLILYYAKTLNHE